jgi:hypothetical protein
MSKPLSKKMIRDVVTANQPCDFAKIDDVIGGMEDVSSNSSLVKGYLEQMVEAGAFSVEKGNYSIAVKARGGAAPTRLYRVQRAKDGTLSLADAPFNAEKDGTDGWRRTALAAIKVFKAEAYQAWLDVLGPIKALQAEHTPVKEAPDQKAA